MAGKSFDSHDIRSEMGYKKDDVPSKEIHADFSQSTGLEVVPVQEAPVPIAMIAPGEPGNEIDLENPPDFSVLREMFPPSHPSRRSKRQKGYNPDFTPNKRYRFKGDTSAKPSLIDEEHTSGDDSGDEDYELVPRKRQVITEEKAPSSEGETGPLEDASKQETDDPPIYDEEMVTLAQFMTTLKRGKNAESSNAANMSDNEPDAEMMQEFEDNRVGSSDASDSLSSSSTDDFNEDEEAEASSEDEEESAEQDVAETVAQESVQDVARISSNIDFTEYDVEEAFCRQFYLESAMEKWPIYVHREFVDEKNIDLDAFDRQNLVGFMKESGLFSSVTTVRPYCKKVVQEFYANLSSSMGVERSGKFGKVFVRGHIYKFSPELINTLYHVPTPDNEELPPDINEITSVITGGLINLYPTHPGRLSGANLTSFYSVLHKVAIHNWTPSKNSTIVTRFQAVALYAIGKGRSWNFGHQVFDSILQFADGGCKGSMLLFPSLIYAALIAQGFSREAGEPLSDSRDLLKISPTLLKGNRRIDLPLGTSGSNSGPVPPVSTGSNDYVLLPPAHLQTQINFALDQIVHAKSVISYYESLIAEYRLLMDMGLHSGHKGGDKPTDEEVEEAGDVTATEVGTSKTKKKKKKP